MLDQIIRDENYDLSYGAPAMLIVLVRQDLPTHMYGGSLVTGSLMLAAHALRVGSCWIHRAMEQDGAADSG